VGEDAVTTPTRKRRGAASQSIVASYLVANGFPYATDAGAGRNGVDILGTAGLSWEVKARRGFSPLAWIRQAAGSPGLPLVVLRPDGMGPASIADWPVTLRLSDVVSLLRAAGYGDPEVGDER
jgi:hypothetical protein